MLTQHDPAQTQDHLLALAAELADADGQDPPDAARLSLLAWRILAELGETALGQIDTELRLTQAYTAARAAVASRGMRDPLIHVRRLLALYGEIPPPGTAATTILAWPRWPERARGYIPGPKPSRPRWAPRLAGLLRRRPHPGTSR